MNFRNLMLLPFQNLKWVIRQVCLLLPVLTLWPSRLTLCSLKGAVCAVEIELGKEFLFAGEEYRVQGGNTDFYIGSTIVCVPVLTTAPVID